MSNECLVNYSCEFIRNVLRNMTQFSKTCAIRNAHKKLSPELICNVKSQPKKFQAFHIHFAKSATKHNKKRLIAIRFPFFLASVTHITHSDLDLSALSFYFLKFFN